MILTWEDVEREAEGIDPAQRDLLFDISAGKKSAGSASMPSPGPWYISEISVQGHAGIGSQPLALSFPETNGITVISARNGTGKTSVADAVRHVLSNAMPRGYNIAEENIHYAQREIRVDITNGVDEITVECSGNSGVRWNRGPGTSGPVPAEWIADFERYLPILLYPEISPVIQNPGSFHDFLKKSLELTTLQDLLKEIDALRKSGRDAEARLRKFYERARMSAASMEDKALFSQMELLGVRPGPADCRAFRSAAEALPEKVPPMADLVGVWNPDDTDLIRPLLAAVDSLHGARAAIVDGTAAVHRALNLLVKDPGEHLAALKNSDTCPVCASVPSDWYATALGERDRLSALLKNVTDGEKLVNTRMRAAQSLMPSPLTRNFANILSDYDPQGSPAKLTEWSELLSDWGHLTPAEVSSEKIRSLVARSARLAGWYADVRMNISAQRDKSVAALADVRAHAVAWVKEADALRPALRRADVAESLNRRVERWIKSTRDTIFEPIGRRMVEIWGDLTQDSDLQLTNVSIGGGVRQAGKVSMDLTAGMTPLSTGGKSAEVLSTGQRNVLSLAAYLPRATQKQSPFRFLVLDDPIHVFDNWRVRYLANQLIQLSSQYQIIVFTHDDRLWQELRGLGATPTHIRLDRVPGAESVVRVKDITNPSTQLLNDVQSLVDQEATRPLGQPEATAVATLAMCRQALDSEVVTQLEILGRRQGKTDEEIRDDLRGARKTRDQLNLLNGYLGALSGGVIDYSSSGSLIDVLNIGTHGRSWSNPSIGQIRGWIKETRKLANVVRRAVG